MADEPMAGGGPSSPEGEKNLEDAPPTFGKLALQFFLIPLLIVGFCVAIVFLFRWLTYEHKNVDDYLAMLRQSQSAADRSQAAKGVFDGLITYIPEAKRWQGIYDMTQQLRADKERFLREHPGFTSQIIEIFENSREDPKVRRYLALTLGVIGDEKSTSALTKATGDSDTETVIAALLALGNAQDTNTIPAILEAARSSDAGVRQTAVYVLGQFDDESLTRPLEAALNDADELVTWNAAFGLARRGSAGGEKVLTRLLDFEYVSKKGSLTVDQRQRYRAAAVQQLTKLHATNAVPLLEKLSVSDPDMPVRQAAIAGLRQLKRQS